MMREEEQEFDYDSCSGAVMKFMYDVDIKNVML